MGWYLSFELIAHNIIAMKNIADLDCTSTCQNLHVNITPYYVRDKHSRCY